MSDKTRQKRSKVPAARRYGEALQALELQGSTHVVPIREYVRQLRTEARQYRIKARQLRQRDQEGESEH